MRRLILCVSFCLILFNVFAPAHGATIAISFTDGSGTINLYNSSGSLLGNWTPDGAVSDIAYDQTTGDLYAFTSGGVYKRTPGGVQSPLGIYSAPQGQGGDIAVSPTGNFAFSQTDVSPTINLYNSSGALLGYWTPDGPVSDIAYDQTTGDLYAFTQGAVYKRTPGGVQSFLGIYPAPPTQGGDIAVSPTGNFAFSQTDVSPTINLYNSSGALLGYWTPDGSVSDIAYDQTTGDLYAFTSGQVYKRTPGGVQSFLGMISAPVDLGGDIAVYNPVPIPGAIWLLGSGLIGLVGIRRKFKK